MQQFEEEAGQQVFPKTDKCSEPAGRHRWLRFVFPVTGLFALIWFFIRVIPKPSRATYPCQRVAFPLASSFVIWLMGLGGSVAAIRKAKVSFAKARPFLAVVCILLSVGSIWVALNVTADKLASAAVPPLRVPQAANAPIGVAKGIHPGRVVWVHDPEVSNWDGSSNYWYDSNFTDQTVANNMMSRAIRGVAGTPNIDEAWDMIFRHFNQEKGKGDVGYIAGEKVTIKVNYVGHYGGYGTSQYAVESNYFDSSPQMIYALLDQLVNAVGVSEADITVGDPLDVFADCFYNYLSASFPSVNYLDAFGQGGRTQATPSTERMYWSTPDAALNTPDYVPQQYVDATYFINLATLKGHYNQGGITVCGKNHYGSFVSQSLIGTTGRYARKPKEDVQDFYNLHSGLLDSAQEVGGHPAMGYYRPLVDIMGHPQIGGKTMLYLIDGLYASKHASADTDPKKWNMAPFNNDWTSSMFASEDPVAIDSVAFDFLYAEWPQTWGPASEGVDDYLHEAALADNPPSRSFYDPDNDGTGLSSLGVHEHWDDPVNKQYTRNLGTGDGIELFEAPPFAIPYDLDFDGKIDLNDYAILTEGWDGSLWDYLVVLLGNWLDGASALAPIWVFDGEARSPWVTSGATDQIPFEAATAPDGSPALVADMPAGSEHRWCDIRTDGGGKVIGGERIHFEFDLFFDTDSKPGHKLSAMHIQVNGDLGWSYKWDAKDPDYPVPSMCWIDGVYQDMDGGVPNNDLPMTGMEWHHVKIDLTTNVAPALALPLDAELGIIRLCFGHDLLDGGGIAYIKNVCFTSPPDYGGNKKPWVNAGLSQTLFWPDDSLLLDGTVVDDGLPDPPGEVSVTWELVDGPDIVSFANANAVDTMATFSGPGTYTLRLTADDGALGDSSETVVEVIPADYPAGSVYVFNEDGFQNYWQPGQFDYAPDTNSVLYSENTAPEWAWSRIGAWASTEIDGSAYLEFDAYFDTTVQPSNTINAICMNVNKSPSTFRWKWEASSQICVDGIQSNMDSYSVTGNAWHHFKLILNTVYSHEGVTGVTFPSDPNIGEIAFNTPVQHAIYLKRVAFTKAVVVNTGPTVEAGPNQEIAWPNNTVSLDGTVEDDGLPDPPGACTVTWSKASGPGTVSFGDENAEDTTATFSAVGTYVLGLRASDGIKTGYDEMTVTVLMNEAPSVDAGRDQQLTLPADWVILDGTVIDDGLPETPGACTYSWEKVDGPGTVTFGDANAVDTTATFSTDGSYTLRLTAEDGALEGSDEVTIIIRPEHWVEIVFDTASSRAHSLDVNTVSWNHTVGTGGNRILVVGLAMEDSSLSDLVINSVTYNSIAMSHVPGSDNTVTGYVKTDLWYLLNPPTGTYQVLVAFAGKVRSKICGSVSLSNVAQQAPIAVVVNSVATYDTSISTDIDVPTASSWVVDVVAGSNGAGSFTETAAEMSLRWAQITDYSSGASSTKESSSGATTLSYTNTANGRMCHSLAAFAPAE